MTARTGSMAVDGTLISQTDLARIAAEETLHSQQARNAARVVASASSDVDDCRMLLSVLGLGEDVVRAARLELAAASGSARKSRAA